VTVSAGRLMLNPSELCAVSLPESVTRAVKV
jgi:hypothetical protein